MTNEHDGEYTQESCPASSVSAQEPKVVLLVDDDPKLLRGLERCFTDEEFRLLTAISPAEANIILAAQRVDLIISDNLMSGGLGTEFLAEVRESYPEIKLMLMSGYLPAAAAERAMEEIGVAQVLNKPCQSTEVAAAIRAMLGDAAD